MSDPDSPSSEIPDPPARSGALDAANPFASPGLHPDLAGGAEPEPVAAPWRGPGFWLSLACTVFLLMVQSVFGGIVFVLAMVLDLAEHDATMLMITAGSSAILLAALAINLLVFRFRTPAVLGVARMNPGHALLVVLTVLPLAIVSEEIAFYAAEFLPTFSAETYQELAEQPFALLLIVGCLLPAVGEEIFFRGFLGRGLVASYGFWFGCLLSAILFSAVHVDPVQMTGLLPVGLALEGIYLATKSLRAPMLLHFLNNAFSFALLKYGALEDLDHFPLPLVAGGTAALVASAVVFYQTRAEWILPDGAVWSPGYVTAEAPPAELGAVRRARRPSALVLIVALLAHIAFLAAAASVAADM